MSGERDAQTLVQRQLRRVEVVANRNPAGCAPSLQRVPDEAALSERGASPLEADRRVQVSERRRWRGQEIALWSPSGGVIEKIWPCGQAPAMPGSKR